MEKLRFLKVQFDTEIAPYEIPAFRGAIINKVGIQNSVLFHNHIQEKFRYGYPLIQYKCIGKKPMIMCVGEGVDEIHKFFQNTNWNISISDRQLDMKIDRLDMNQFTMQVWDKTFTYEIRNWIALNQQAYKDYMEMETLQEKITLLQSKLVGNILSLAKGVNWTIDKEIICKIIDLKEPRTVKVKGIKMLGFNLTFKSNVFLPNYIGLGSKVSMGFGCVQEVKKFYEGIDKGPKAF